jgi:hypothetical protein
MRCSSDVGDEDDRITNSRACAVSGGRPGARRAYVQRRRTSSRCQRNTVAGCTRNDRRRSRGSIAANDASRVRSAGRTRARATCRRRTCSSWRRTRISTSFTRSDRIRSTSSSSRHLGRAASAQSDHDAGRAAAAALSAPRLRPYFTPASKAKAHAERWVRSVRRECFMAVDRLAQALGASPARVRPGLQRRPHRALEQRPPLGKPPRP